MKNAQKPDHASLNTVLGWLREGRYVVPDFQREFEWQPWDIRDLVRSIFLDHYIGSLLLWKGKPENFEALSCEPIYGLTGNGHRDYIVLDGQQRLTALYYAFVAPNRPLPNRSTRALYSVRIDRFMAEQYDAAFQYDWTSKRLDALFANQAALFAEHIFPCSVIGAGGWELPNWVQGYESFWSRQADRASANGDECEALEARHHAANAKEFGQHLKAMSEEYQISHIELDQDLAIDKVCDIFTQLNSRGVRLDVFDLMNALLKPKGLQLKHMWRAAASQLEFVSTEKMNVYVLQVMSLLRQTYCSPKYLYYLLPGQEKPVRELDGARHKEILVPRVTDFEHLWQRAVAALTDSLKLLRHPQEFGAISAKYLPYVSILPVFAALQAHLASCPVEQRFSGQRKIRQWYWASVFTNRYSGAVESTSARDYQDVRAWIDDDAAEPAPIQEFKGRFRTLDLRQETKSGTSVYNGLFNLLVLNGARDWTTGNVPQYDNLDDHHIVPASWGMKHLTDTSIHTVLNRTPLTAETNRVIIGDNLPNVYLRKMIAASSESAVLTTLASHCISPAAFEILMRDPFEARDFAEFINERHHIILDAIEDLLIKERLALSPRLRELDADVEAIELDLRQVVDCELTGEMSLLPQHVAQKAQERLQVAVRKNPSLDRQGPVTLSSLLEYFDLREIQDTMTSKAIWPRFTARFGNNKEALVVKFGQLAELRNGLRHSRTVDEVSRKEGEAAIVWFKQMLSD